MIFATNINGLEKSKTSRGQNMQEYIQEFWKGTLKLGIPLYMQKNILKYIGELYSYLRHTIDMFKADNINEACVQATHIESRGNNFHENLSKKIV